jgi:hypothetical protein
MTETKKPASNAIESSTLFCWKFECFTDAEDSEKAWENLRYLVEIATEYRKENGEYPGMAAHAPNGSVTLREDQWGNMVRENERLKQNKRISENGNNAN